MTERLAANAAAGATAPRGPLPAITLLGARLDAVTECECAEFVLDEIAAGRGGSILTMNLDHLRRFVTEPSYAECHRAARIVTADGMPLIWASRIQGTPLPERVTGANLIWTLSAAAALQGRSIFLLGGDAGAAAATAAALRRKYFGIRIAGVSNLPVDFENEAAIDRLAARLVASQPDIVYVALGSPKQENFIGRVRGRLPGAWWLGVGIAFSFASGQVPRAPRWMQNAGLEWLHRLLHDPVRLSKRYLAQGIPFAFTLFRRALLERARAAWRDVEPNCERV